MPQRVVFLDRDGTINVDRGFVHRIKDWQFVPGAIKAIRQLRAAGYALAIVTNQSAIAAGAYTVADVDRLHTHMLAELARHGTTIDAIAICPHAPSDNCSCRKPQPGMAREIEHQLRDTIDYPSGWTIGDKPHDIAFGRNLGSRTILLRSQYWELANLSHGPDHVADSFFDGAKLILGEQASHPALRK